MSQSLGSSSIFLHAAGAASAWALGVAIGTAAGASLTVSSGQGAPGVSAAGTSELLWLPLGAGLAVYLIAFVVYMLIGTSRAHKRGEYKTDGPEREDGEVTR